MKRHTPKQSQPDDRTETVGARSWEALWESALAYQPEPIRPAGEGWKSTPELADELNLSKQGVADRMSRLVKRGIMEKACGRSGPSLVRCWFYRPVVR
jgi:predicted HTH transcriptional regulator